MQAQPMPLRLPFELPVLEAKSQIVCRGILNLHGQLTEWDVTELRSVADSAPGENITRDLLLGLQDELSDMFPNERPALPSHDKGKIEAQVLAEIASRDVQSVCSDEATFIDFLVEIHRRLLPEAASKDGLRTRGVQSLVDHNGRYVIYPPPNLICPALGQLSRLAAVSHEQDPVLLATYAMVNLCAVHPFSDGNGRLSRILFNWFLCRASGNPIYLPLLEFGDLSRNGWYLALRRAQFQSDWNVIIQFILTCLRIMKGTGPQADAGAPATR
jgi:Fic family protein